MDRQPPLGIITGVLVFLSPASLPEADHEFASQLGGSVHALHDGRDEAVASQLQRIIVSAAAEQVDDSPSVTTIYRRPQGGALLL